MNVMLLLLASCASVAAPPPSAPDLSEIRLFETRYLQTVDEGNVAAQLEMVSHDPAVYSILDGEVWLGWDAVKAQAEAYVPISKLVGNAVDKIEIIPLNADTAIVVLQVHSVKRDPANTSFPDMSGFLTHVLRKEAKGWMVLHEHFSTSQTPEFIAWKAALIEAQRRAATEKK